MALDAGALITVAEARVYLGTTSTQKPATEWLEQVINGLSAQISSYTGRTYVDGATETVRYFSHDGGQTLEIDDVRDVSLIRVSATPKETDSWSELDEDSWIAEPENEDVKRRIRFLTPLELPVSNFGWHWDYIRQWRTEWPRETVSSLRRYTVVEVTGIYGFESVPSNVKLACEMWLQNIHKRDAAFFSNEISEVTVSLEMPEDVKALLDTERRETTSVAAV